MNRDEAYRAEEIFDQLEKYKTPKYQELVQELRGYVQPIIDNERRKEIKAKHLERCSYGQYTPVRRVSQVVENLNNAVSLYEEALGHVEVTQKATQDILHALELLDMGEEEMLKMAKDLHEIRSLRREAKDFTDIMLPFYNFAKKLKDNGWLKELGQIHNAVMDITKKKDGRTYTPREKTELAVAFEKAAENLANS